MRNVLNTARPRRAARHLRLAAAALAAASTLTLSACGTRPTDGALVADVSVAPDAGKPGTVLDRPFEKPDLVLTDTTGKPYDLRARTKGKPTLVYFGYTHCPDVCPLTMSNLAEAMRRLPAADRDKLEVVFITTDPERDTPAELAKWLPSAGDPGFVGLSGEFPKIQAGARQLGIGIDPPSKDKDGKVVSMHGAQVMAFSPKNDRGYVVYGENTTADQYAEDLPKLIRGENP
ncbi:SCO family protein [Streptomyces somaliensis DSM 40738]|uniref:SCO family protein n=1 Tax=Streptomyces somaliensis (strain ATCC 33201 / DSM 40738 / JCM 12659 / KCTC 9044 / NCTC 11332 / NRRL B-12077 / IP 733) TaxID=1134445 RepID=A0AA44DH73_STRE0|nr:SCO family protein [Streptomyces somaliensis]MCQ0024678.1 SCO family protein [Streptomyces somaliensis DSM 40738]NKY16395.1 SCO family protein [Streptomyces somaliensis DSM 40738]